MIVEVIRPRRTPGDSAWFTDARFGMFIHWGLYSLTAREFFAQRVDAMSGDEYELRYLEQFDPDLYDPEEWADTAVRAGMKYVVMVAKHHEGFCLWDSAYTDFKATNSPAGRDLLRPALDAFRSRGLKVGLYYSLLDWHHPDFTVDPQHPLAHGDQERLNRGRDMDRYRRYVADQMRELLTDYGRIDIFWPDYSYDLDTWRRKATSQRNLEAFAAAARTSWTRFDLFTANGKGGADWGAEDLLSMIRELQPGILLNDRMGLEHGWDITTPEQTVPDEWPKVDGEPALWESCQTFSGFWGYTRSRTDWKSPEQLVGMLIDVVSKGGNLLLNVGPTGRGDFEDPVSERLSAIGRWMRRHSRSISGCTQAPEGLVPELPRGIWSTYNPTTRRLYLHLLAWPTGPIVIPGIAQRTRFARMLHDASELRRPEHPLFQLHAPPSEDLWLDLPVDRPDELVPVIEIQLEGS